MIVVKIKKAKGTKKCVKKRKLKVENYKNCFEATSLDNKVKYLEKNEMNIASLKNVHKEFIKDNKLILKTQERFKSERHIVFTEEINKIALSLNYDKRIQSNDSIETYLYGTSKELLIEKAEIKCNNMIK